MLKELDLLSKQKGIKVDDLFRKGNGMGNLDADIIYSEILNSFIQKIR